MARCKSCGAEIRWVKTARGKAMPLDPAPTLDGSVWFDVFGVAHVGDPPIMGMRRYTSHFASCPQAGQHRKVRES